MINFLIRLINAWTNRESLKLGGKQRSSRWPAFKKEFEKKKPKRCAVCGNENSQLHHKIPFAKDPSKELLESNVLWLCEGEGTLNHHRGHGHLGSFLSFNEKIDEDARIWSEKIRNRP